jgi:transcription termination factor Rho
VYGKYIMTRKTLSFNIKRKTEVKKIVRPAPNHDANQEGRPVAKVLNNVPSDPKKSFLSGIAIHPFESISLASGSDHLTTRAMDLITPIGMGQRGLIVAPPGCGKTTLLKHICMSVSQAYPDIKLYALLIDERPEEVTDFKRAVSSGTLSQATVVASSSDESYEHHVRVANELLNTALKQAGEGHNVMIVIDSLTRLSRVHNAERKSSGRTMSGGLDARALEIPRKLFGAARKIENGGSLTILATILVDTGSRMDQVIFEEFKGTGNMEIVLSRDIANQRIFPALDIAKSSTRREELLIDSKDYASVKALRRSLTSLEPAEGAKKLIELLNEFPTNAELLNR